MRVSLLLWIVWLMTVGPARAQPTSNASAVEDPDAPSIEETLLAEGLFRAIDLQFETGRSTLLPHSVSVLDAVAEVLVRHPSIRLEIAGHTDAAGSAALNMRLSEERARAVKAYLTVRHGIESDRLQATGYGSSVPIASNNTATGRALNRRVEFRILHAGADRIPSADDVSRDRRRPVDADSVRMALQRQVEDAVRAALAEGDPDSSQIGRLADLEDELEERLARLERELTRDSLPTVQPSGVGQPALPVAQPRRMASRFGLLPFTGVYLRGDLPIVIGVRADIPTALFGSASFQPEAAVGFRPDDQATLVNANLVFPVRIASYADILPFFGVGVGFHDIEGFESVLNLLVGLEHRFEFGILFGELMTQDFSDFNRVVMGFRQNF